MKPTPLPKIQGKPLAPILGALMEVKPEKIPPKKTQTKKKQS